MMNYIFDLDDTLVKRDTVIPLPGRIEALDTISNNNNRIYVATNNSGPAWRSYSEALREKDFKKYPSLKFSFLRLEYLVELFNINSCFAAMIPGDEFVAKDIRFGLPRPDEVFSLLDGKLHVSYKLDWRKPGGGMLEFICSSNGIEKSNCLFVGDLPTDEKAARNAGIAFQHANEFFTI